MERNYLVFVAKDLWRDGRPVFLFLEDAPYAKEKYPVESTELVNELIRCKNADQLIAVASKTGPMVAGHSPAGYREYQFRDLEILFDAPEDERLAPLDYESLQQLMYFENPNIGFSSKASVQRVLKEFDATSPDNRRKMSEWRLYCKNGVPSVYIEPIADYMFARNCASLAVRLAGLCQSYDDEPVLEYAGFREIQLASSPSRYYVIPFAYGVESSLDTEGSKFCEAAPLLGECTSVEKKKFRLRDSYEDCKEALVRAFGCHVPGAFFDKSSDGVLGLEPLYDLALYEGLDYLCVEKSEYLNQLAVATTLFEAICEVFQNLVHTDISRSWDANREIAIRERVSHSLGWTARRSWFNDLGSYGEPSCKTELAALFARVAYMEGCSPRVCRHCGNGILDVLKGRDKDFCCNSCRAAFYANPENKRDEVDD